MRILGEIETGSLVPHFAKMVTKMKQSMLGSEIVVIEYNISEMKVLNFDFDYLRKKNKWVYTSQEQLEKAELMHMISVALANANKGSCSWFKSAAPKILTDAMEFDDNSKKTLVMFGGKAYIILVYNGKWIGGEKKNDRIIRDESHRAVDSLG